MAEPPARHALTADDTYGNDFEYLHVCSCSRKCHCSEQPATLAVPAELTATVMLGETIYAQA